VSRSRMSMRAQVLAELGGEFVAGCLNGPRPA